MTPLYFVRSLVNPTNVLCEDGEMRWEGCVGPGGYRLKTWKTRAGAERSQKAFLEGGFRKIEFISARPKA